MSKYKEKSTQIIEFSGKKEVWPIWSRKFLARAEDRKYRDFLEGLEKIS